MFLDAIGPQVLKGRPDTSMKISALVVKQALVGHLLRQGMLESEAHVGKNSGLLDDTQFFERFQRLQ